MCLRQFVTVIHHFAASIAVALWPEKRDRVASSSSNGAFCGINLSIKFVVGVLTLCAIISFTIGYFSRPFVLPAVLSVVNKLKCTMSHNHNSSGGTLLPPQVVTETRGSNDNEERLPLSIDRSSAVSHVKSAVSSGAQIDEDKSTSTDDEKEKINENSQHKDSHLHFPAGQHLLVDMKNVDSKFLNSEKQLATAMVDLITETKLTLLSYHCHSLVPIGVSCVGILLESHVALHTWPLEGIISMDLFTCGNGRLVPILPLIKKLFGVKAAGEVEEPAMLWSHKLRGFRKGFVPEYDESRNPFEFDLGERVAGRLDHDIKNPVVSTETEFQAVDVYELMEPSVRNMISYQKSLENDGSYESLHPEYFGPNRILLLDGVIQSSLYGDAPYHEGIVHPALITHPNPKRVAIIGGGEGATLREILKHSTVEQAVMVEIDESVVSLSKEYLPEWQDCSSIAHHEGRAAWCFDDTRVDARFEDALAYFINNFSSNKDRNDVPSSSFDVIIMDCLDPDDDVPFAQVLYTSNDFLNSLYNALTDEGILVVQVGRSPTFGQAADETGAFVNRHVLINKLDEVGFKR